MNPFGKLRKTRKELVRLVEDLPLNKLLFFKMAFEQKAKAIIKNKSRGGKQRMVLEKIFQKSKKGKL